MSTAAARCRSYGHSLVYVLPAVPGHPQRYCLRCGYRTAVEARKDAA